MNRSDFGFASVLSVAILGGCGSAPRLDRFDLDLPGPTLMARVERGYELKNRHVRLVIDDATGDVVYWGVADGDANLLGAGGITATPRISPEAFLAPTTQPFGYVEKRDDQTWQYLGETSNRLGWRKIYCLEGDAVYVTYLVQNLREERLTVTVEVTPNFTPLAKANLRRTDAMTLSTTLGSMTATLHAFNQSGAEPSLPNACRSDPHLLQPAERASFTMEWRLR